MTGARKLSPAAVVAAVSSSPNLAVLRATRCAHSPPPPSLAPRRPPRQPRPPQRNVLTAAHVSSRRAALPPSRSISAGFSPGSAAWLAQRPAVRSLRIDVDAEAGHELLHCLRLAQDPAGPLSIDCLSLSGARRPPRKTPTSPRASLRSCRASPALSTLPSPSSEPSPAAATPPAGGEVGADVIFEVVSALRGGGRIRSLSIQREALTGQSLEAAAQLVSADSPLEELRLDYCSLGDDGAAALAVRTGASLPPRSPALHSFPRLAPFSGRSC